MNAVIWRSFSPRGIDQNASFKSNVENTALPCSDDRDSATVGKVYESCSMRLFKPLRSTQNLSAELPGFGTNNTGEE